MSFLYVHRLHIKGLSSYLIPCTITLHLQRIVQNNPSITPYELQVFLGIGLPYTISRLHCLDILDCWQTRRYPPHI
jgi:hypothetical protein